MHIIPASTHSLPVFAPSQDAAQPSTYPAVYRLERLALHPASRRRSYLWLPGASISRKRTCTSLVAPAPRRTDPRFRRDDEELASSSFCKRLDILEFFRAKAETNGTGHQTMINFALRATFSQASQKEGEEPLTVEKLRQVLREELPKRLNTSKQLTD